MELELQPNTVGFRWGVAWGRWEWRGLALKSAATVTSFVFLFTVLCFLYFVTVNQFCMSDFFTRLRQLYNLLTPSWQWERVATLLRVADAAAAAAAAAASVQKRS